jgi:hypothetical protein
MAAGITRKNGSALTPSQRPSTISFYNIQFPGINVYTGATTTSDVAAADGALDQIFRTAIPTVATVAMIGTPKNQTTSTINFAIEDTGVDTNSVTGLGLGNGTTTSSSTAAAFQTAVRALGTVNGINCATAVVSSGIAFLATTTSSPQTTVF